MSEWKKVKLGDYIDVLSGFAYKSKDFSDSGIPVIKIKNVCPPYISLEDLSYVPNSIAFQNPRYILKKGDVLIAMTGSHINQIASVVGRVGRVRYDDITVLNQRVGKSFIPYIPMFNHRLTKSKPVVWKFNLIKSQPAVWNSLQS